MMNEEEYLNSKMGRKNPFTVPEGYFDRLAEQVMAQLPEAAEQPKQPARIVRLRPWSYAAAACVCVAVFAAALLFNNKSDNGTQGMRQVASMEQESTNYYSDNYIEEEANYAMVDNQEIYAYLLAEM